MEALTNNGVIQGVQSTSLAQHLIFEI